MPATKLQKMSPQMNANENKKNYIICVHLQTLVFNQAVVGR